MRLRSIVRHPIQFFNCCRHYDYAAPRLVPLPGQIEGFFPDGQRRWPINTAVPHTARYDRRFPGVGWLTWDEATILYNYGLMCRGEEALEIGCWVGWSSAVLGLSGVRLIVVDPVLNGAPQGESCRQSLRRAGLLDAVTLVPGCSPAAVESLARNGRQWSCFFVDGNHEKDAPLRDVQQCVRCAAADCVIILHDCIQPNITAALGWLQKHGWNCAVHYTAMFIGVASRAQKPLIEHTPDPRIPWGDLVQRQWPHLAQFRRA